MRYDIKLRIGHQYTQPAGNGRHVARVLPRVIPGRQTVLTHFTDISPLPSERLEGIDFFGNPTTTLVHKNAHDEMLVKLACRVEVMAQSEWLDFSCDLRGIQRQWEAYQGLEADSPLHFLGPSPRLTANSQITHFARSFDTTTESGAAMVMKIGKALHDLMAFDPKATTVDTDASEAFRLKRGVCQDFSHIMILALRSLNIPAGYVSGYLRTLPPEGGVRLEGADAMHAWVRAWCGAEQGWIEYDPTNATLVGSDHIIVGYGRDYSDVAPVIGHLRSSGSQTSTQSVDVALSG
ncbi:MAG: transglutaminase domain-containing protein [Roseobacter sp.]